MRENYLLKQNIFKSILYFGLLFSFIALAQAPAIHSMARMHHKKNLVRSFLDGSLKGWRQHCDIDVIKDNNTHIKAMADKYGVLADSGRYILCYEYYDDEIKDFAQDWLAEHRLLPLGIKGFFPNLDKKNVGPDAFIHTPLFVAQDKYDRSEAIANRDLAYFFQIFQENRVLEKDGQQPDNAPRNGRDHWIFSTVGIAEFGLFTALSFVIDGYVNNPDIVKAFQNSSGQWDLNNVAQTLVKNEKYTIEILFARIKRSRDVYMEYANKDILYSFSTILQLHTMGYFKYHALQRQNNLKSEELPEDVLDCLSPDSTFDSDCVPLSMGQQRRE
ncbi:hypothetical protein MRY82_04435 [bacterium]|nr:hypothetical protein [bacterium]